MSDVRKTVREAYGRIARAAITDSSPAAACGSPPTCCGPEGLEGGVSVPDGTDLGLGSGDPVGLADLKPGETVLDLGSGGGVDCFLAARVVGETGTVIGVDMTPEMIELARGNATKAGASNIEFRLGEIERLPVSDGSVDVVISNCVVNLSPDKASALREAYRVLRPGGRLAISDIVAARELPEEIRRDAELHASCVAGAVTVPRLEKLLADAGFEGIRIGVEAGESPSGGDDLVVPATVEATKP